MAEKLQNVLKQSFAVEGNRIYVTASIGITLSDHQYKKTEDVLRDADVTMYEAKDRGRARYEVFDQSLRAAALTRLKMETEMRMGIAQKQFELFYQPIINAQTWMVEGFEALIRWRHPTQGLISPSVFIPVAEETGLIITLGEMIFQLACEQLVEWSRHGLEIDRLKMSINLSGKQLMSPDLMLMINRAIATSPISPHRIKLEITESVLLEQDYQAIEILHRLRDSGFEISLDDFGTGYSSLSYLQRLPIDTLKIDRSFVQKMQRDVRDKNLAIVQSIVTLSHALGLSVIAEGVETKEQLRKLQALGCEYVQGYLFSPPVDPEMATRLLQKRIIDIA